MKKRTKIFFVAVKKITLLTILIGVILTAYFSYLIISPKSSLNEKFFGKKAEYQGVIKLWHVDTFEGGNASRVSYLNSVASAFEKKFKGAMIMVQNMSIDELKANLNNEIYPDMFSFGTGLGGMLKNKMQPQDEKLMKTLMPNFVSAGLDNGKFLLVPYAYGVYSLLSTSSHIENAKSEVKPLKEIMFDLSYDKVMKKSTKHIYSLTFGKNDYTDASRVFTREFSDVSLVSLAGNGVLDKDYLSQTSYEAYLKFVGGKSSVLLGTQRDVFRMENRVNSGVSPDLLVEPLGKFTDLVNFISIINTDKNISAVCKNFIEFLLTEAMQRKLKDIGLFSPLGISLYEEGSMSELEKSITESTIIQSGF